VVERICPLCVISHLSPYGFIAPLPLKINPHGMIPPTLRTFYLKFLVTKRLRKIIKICLPTNIYNSYSL